MDKKINIDLEQEILQDLTTELEESDSNFNSTLLLSKIKNALREVKRVRKYPTYYTDKQIETDMYEYYSNIRNLALYDYNQIGIEFQNNSVENGISRGFVDRNSLFSGIIPLSKF